MACGFDSSEAFPWEMSDQQEVPNPGSVSSTKTDNESSMFRFSFSNCPVRHFTGEQRHETNVLNKYIKNISDVFTERLDAAEQMLKYKNVVLHGVHEDPNEELEQVVLGVFQDIMRVQINASDIEKCFRTGGEMFPRAVVVKLSSCQKKHEVMKHKLYLKGTHVEIHEDLCPGTQKLLKDAEKKFGEKNVSYKNYRNGGMFVIRPPGCQQITFKNRSELRKYMELHSGV